MMSTTMSRLGPRFPSSAPSRLDLNVIAVGVALLSLACEGPARAAPGLQADPPSIESSAIQQAAETTFALLQPSSATAAQEPETVWVAAHTVTILWDGSDEDARAIGRLPVGSYFQLTGDSVGDRLPVLYLGNRTVPAGRGWIRAADLGPIPAPAADWTEPDFPPRRLLVGERGELIRGDPSLPLIALTFDAGAGVGSTVQLLDVLRNRGVRATFFIAGAYADRYPSVIERMAADGHELANHSYTHPDFRNLSEAQMRSEIRRGTSAIEVAAGARIAPLWRPPFGSRNSQILRVVEEEGFRSVFWTFDSGDWIEGATATGIRNTDLSRAVPGAVVVHHVSPLATAQAMPAIVDELRRRGYELVTVSELIGP
jgi:peptidoglycan/xylan/chitin deacetylase (PgdA/CDA1 family)